MSDPVMVAAVQMTSTEDKSRNLATATRLTEQAVQQGAQLVSLPELFNCLGTPDTIRDGAEPIPGPTSNRLGQLAAEHKIHLLAGSIAERVEESEKIFNTSLLFGPDGNPLAAYRKIHLFDIDLPGKITFKESGFMAFGNRLEVTASPIGRIGQATCYDLRFPELFRLLVDRGAELMIVPSAFSLPTGRDHWQVLLRARAIENQVFIIAPNQYGAHTPSLSPYGHSLIVDPWGTVLAMAADGEGVITASVDYQRQREIRKNLPALRHRRLPEHLEPSS